MQAELREIVRRISERINPVRIILFGSFARGEQTDDSDFDLFLIVDNGTDTRGLTGEAYDSLWGMRRRAVDILIDEQSVYEARTRIPSIERTVSREGVTIFRRGDDIS